MTINMLNDFVYGGAAEALISPWNITNSSASSTIDLAGFNPNGALAADGTDNWLVHRNGIDWTSNAAGATLILTHPTGFPLVTSGEGVHVGLEFYTRSAAAAPYSIHLAGTDGVMLGRRKIIATSYRTSNPVAIRLDLVGDLGITPGATIGRIVFTDVSGAARLRTTIDEIRFVKVRARYHPGTPYFGLRRGKNEWSAYAPELWKPATEPVTGAALVPYPIDSGFDPYYAEVNGNCSGNEESIMEWATKKWWGPTNVVDGVDWSNDLLLALPASLQGTATNWLRVFKAEAWKESNWQTDLPGDWETFNYAPYNDPDHRGNQSHGIYQAKGPRFWVPYPHPLMSIGWAADFLMALIRAHADAAIYTKFNANFKLDGTDGASKTIRFRRAMNCYYAGSPAATMSEQTGNTPSDGAYSSYVCQVLGGTVTNQYEADHLTNYDATCFAVTQPWTSLTP